MENNRWYCIEQYAKLNQPGEANGILRGWVDGDIAFEKTDIRLRSVDKLKIENVWINFYHGGTWNSESEHHVYIDEVVISKSPIGVLGLTDLGIPVPIICTPQEMVDDDSQEE